MSLSPEIPVSSEIPIENINLQLNRWNISCFPGYKLILNGMALLTYVTIGIRVNFNLFSGEIRININDLMTKLLMERTTYFWGWLYKMMIVHVIYITI